MSVWTYRKRPLVIEAVPALAVLRAIDDNWLRVPHWIRHAWLDHHIDLQGNYVLVRTLEGVVSAEQGDWIVRGIAGELYPVRGDIFADTYEKVDV